MSKRAGLDPDWREVVAGLHKEVLQHGAATLQSISTALITLQTATARHGRLAAIESTVSDALVLVGQQLAEQHSSKNSSRALAQQPSGHLAGQNQQQQQQQLQLLQTCCTYCEVVSSTLAAVQLQQQQQSPHKRYGWLPKQQQQQQPSLMPARAATSISASLRLWADQQPPVLGVSGSSTSASNGVDRTSILVVAWQVQLQQCSLKALGALLQQHLHVLAAHERAAVLTLLQALAQPPPESSSIPLQDSSSSGDGGGGGGSSSSEFFLLGLASAAGREAPQQQQQQAASDLQVACTAAHILGQLCRKREANCEKQAGVTADECNSITKALVDALAAACNTRGRSGSSSSSGALGGATRGGSSGRPRGSSSSGGGTRSRMVEDAAHAKYYAVLLAALQQTVPTNLSSSNSSSQNWTAHAAAITEVACKLFTYGTHQQQHQHQHQQMHEKPSPPAAAASSSEGVGGSNPALASSSSSSNVAATSTAAAAVVSAAIPRRYVPPHLRRAVGAPAVQPEAVQSAAVHAGAVVQQQQQPSEGALQGTVLQQQWQQQQDDFLIDIDSTSEWSDSEHGPGMRSGASSSSSSSNSRRGSQSQQQQQSQAAREVLLLEDPIKAYQVRVALLQLLRCLAQADANLLHQYLAALLPTQLPLQQRPLTPHLLTVLLYDPCLKARLLSAAVLSALLEGPAARALMAVAEARAAPRPAVRGFITMSTTLGHMLLALHTGLLAAVQAVNVQQQQQQPVLVPSAPLLCSVLHALSVLMSVTPYERLPGHLLTDTVKGIWGLWQQLRQQQQQQSAVNRSNTGASMTSAASDVLLVTEGSAGSAVADAIAAVIAQAVSTKKRDTRLAEWLKSNTAAAAAAAVEGSATDMAQPQHNLQQQRGILATTDHTTARAEVPLLELGSCSSSTSVPQHSCTSNSRTIGNGSSSGSSSSLVWCLLDAAMSDKPLLRIEALAALRGICINYPEALLTQAAAAADTSSGSSSSDNSSSSWAAIMSAAQHSVAASELVPRSPRSGGSTTPRRSASSSSVAAAGVAGSSSSSEEGSSNASPEDKAAQHAVKLLGDWLAAMWKRISAVAAAACQCSGCNGATGTPAAAAAATVPDPSVTCVAITSQQQQQQQQALQDLGGLWGEALNLLLSQQLQQHPSYVIRSAAVAVTAEIPAAVWQALPYDTQQKLLAATASTAQLDAVAAARATACKVLGNMVVQPGILAQQVCHPDPGSSLALSREFLAMQLVLQPLTSCMKDSAVSVRINASWGIANACDALKQYGDSSTCTTAVPAAVVQLLSEYALAAAVADSEKVRANGIRAVGALLATWQADWGLSSTSPGSSSSSDVGSSSSSDVDWSWVPGWLSGAIGQLQSCLVSRSPKVVWNAAYAVAGLLRNTPLLGAAQVSACIPALLLVLIVLVRDSGNYKIKTHAAAALAAAGSRQVYGECFADAVLVLAAALEALDGGGGSSSSSADVGKGAAATTESNEDDGKFPNFRYVPGLVAQLQASLLHMLALLQPSDAARLKEPLQRRKQQITQLLLQQLHSSDESRQDDSDAAAAATAAAKQLKQLGVQVSMQVVGAEKCHQQEQHRQQQQQGGGVSSEAVPATEQSPGVKSRLPSDPFSQDGS